jgi:hypothetical protein
VTLLTLFGRTRSLCLNRRGELEISWWTVCYVL